MEPLCRPPVGAGHFPPRRAGGNGPRGAQPRPGSFLLEALMTRPREDRFDELFAGATYTDEEREFFQAIDRYKVTTRRRFLSWREVLRVLKSLGYRKPEPE